MPGGRTRFMVGLAVVFVFLGVGYLGDLPASTLSGIEFQTKVLPVRFWATLFVVVGVLCGCSVLAKRLQPAALGAAIGLSLFWAVGSFVSWLENGLRAFVLAVIFTAFTLIISGIVDSRDRED